MELLKLKPVYKEMIWGGDKIQTLYHLPIPSDHTGEAWVVSAHPNGDGLIENGEFAGQALSQVYRENRALFGKGSNLTFPLLIKIIDAKQDLSVQVHPDDEYALSHENSYGKTEFWYVLDCPSQTKMVVGHHLTSKEEYRALINSGNLEPKLNRFDIKKGDYFYIPAKTLHAICANSLIYEVQQNSDITYRVYDYNRKDPSGKQRELHIDKAIDVTQIPYKAYQSESRITKSESLILTELVNESFFSVTKAECFGSSTFVIDDEFVIVGCVEGEVKVNELVLKASEHCLVLNSVRTLHLDGNGTLMISAPKAALL